MDLINAQQHGWDWLRETVFRRDGGCVAVQRQIMGEEVATDSCREGAGLHYPIIERWRLERMEWDHVTQDGVRYSDEAHGITVCPWHHRGSGQRIDTKARRERVREYLRGVYPTVWDGGNVDASAVQAGA